MNDIDSRFTFDQEVRRNTADGERNNLRHLWLISYSDFMTILMIFFLVMYGYTYLAKEALLRLQQQKDSTSEFSQSIEQMQKKLGDQMTIEKSDGQLTLKLGEKILFPSGSAVLTQVAADTLDDLANSIKLVDGAVVVAGHTDNVPVRKGRFKSNWELSAARSFAVIESLTQRGVPAERLSAWGFGENRPVASNLTEKTRAENRRIEVTILKVNKA